MSHDATKRWLGYIDNKGNELPPLKRDFAVMHVVVVADNFEASQMEEDLMKSYKHHKHCLNNSRGGAGVSSSEHTEPYFVYVCFK